MIIVDDANGYRRLIQKGGDWDRLNRLKVYRALHLICIRQFSKAAELFIDALSTFTATELLDYKQFVEFTIISGVVSLNRVDLKKKVSWALSQPCWILMTPDPRCAGNHPTTARIACAVEPDHKPLRLSL